MSFTFKLETAKNQQPWKTISSLDKKILDNWDELRQLSKHYYKQSLMNKRITGELLQHYIKKDESVIATVSKNCEQTTFGMLKSAIFIFTNTQGIVLSISGPEELIHSLNQMHNLGVGSIFTVQNAGLNAISMSIELKDWFFLSGNEHDLKLFKEWNCFCSPVRQNGEIIGYLDMSFSLKDDHILMSTLFSLTLKSIEDVLGVYDQRKLIYEKFKNYRLSPREKEIGYMWINNFSALRIANELGIAEGTVRNVIKKIYSKTKVGDKVQFIREFIL